MGWFGLSAKSKGNASRMGSEQKEEGGDQRRWFRGGEGARTGHTDAAAPWLRKYVM